MKKLLLLSALLISNNLINAASLSAFFSYASFDVPGKTPYVETYLNVVGQTVKFIKAENNKFKGQIEVRWIFRSNDKIVHADKYVLNSPDIEIDSSSIPDFIDQQRVQLPRGSYDVELNIRDKNSDSQGFSIKENIEVGYPQDSLSISSIEFVDSFSKTSAENKFSKSGYDLIPFVNSFYPKEISSLKFYAEIYRTDKYPGEDYVIRYYLSGKENRQILDNFAVLRKQSPKDITPVIGEFNIADLGSGNYFLNIEVRNKTNQLIAFRQAFFQRSNERNRPSVTADLSAIDVTNTFISPIINADTLIDNISCLYPISSPTEIQIGENQIAMANVQSMQQYIYSFWSRRNPEDPEKAWRAYRGEVRKANDMYSSLNSKGYETDRGRVFLKYGAPNAIAEEKNDPNSYPYEIWQYYKLETQSNRKFVFYAPERSTNDYRLIHSDAKGELQEPQWELFLHSRSQQFGIDMDQEKSIDTYGSKTKENFSIPK